MGITVIFQTVVTVTHFRENVTVITNEFNNLITEMNAKIVTIRGLQI